jgi:hypothetical protein
VKPFGLWRVNQIGPPVAPAYPETAWRVGFGPSFGVKLRGVWLFASLAWALFAGGKGFKLLMKLAGTDEADLA